MNFEPQSLKHDIFKNLLMIELIDSIFGLKWADSFLVKSTIGKQHWFNSILSAIFCLSIAIFAFRKK